MKKNVLSVLAVLALLMTACAPDDTADIIINDTSGNGNSGSTNDGQITISGTQINDLTLEAGKDYLLNGSLIMSEGTTLTIEAGTVVKTLASGANVYVAISQGAKIIAEGTAAKPIVFTSNASSPKAGDWGGLIVLGKAPINSVSGSATSTSEIASLPYGGTDSSDNSGVIKYMRLEYTGGKADGQSENNGFSFYGVGNGTVVDYIQAHIGKDDGVEFFGGTVNVSHLVVTGSEDDSIDWTEGFSGKITDAYVKHWAEHDKALEADGFNTDIGNNSDPVFFSKPTVTNLTVVGLGSANEGGEAIRLRAGTQGIFTNILIEGYEEGFDLDGDDGASPTGAGVTSGDLHVTDVTFTDVTVKLKNDTGVDFSASDFISGDGNGTGTDFATWGANWTVE